MAGRLEYLAPQQAPFPTAHDEFNDLIETLHDSGTLRVLNGFFGRFGAVNEALLSELKTPPGQNLLGSLLFLGECLTKLPVDDLQRVASGVGVGLKRADATLREEPPSTLGLFRMMREPDTRRAIAATLALLNAIGAELGRNEEKKDGKPGAAK
jgi:uncharacterized protein YjgD (DUF1641 family)